MSQAQNQPEGFWRPYGFQVPIGPVDPGCPLDLPNCKLWLDENGPKAGRLLGVDSSGLFYAYAACDSEGNIVTTRVNAVHHYSGTSDMPVGWGRAYQRMEDLALAALHESLDTSAHTVYQSTGRAAGVLVDGHVHWNCDARPEDEPASGMGPALLRREYNELSADYERVQAELRRIAGSTMDHRRMIMSLEGLGDMMGATIRASIGRQPNHPSNSRNLP